MKPDRPAAYYYNEICAGNRNVLGQAITIVESTSVRHKKLANEILQLCITNSGNSIRIGVTGVPGAGKSTFIDAFGSFLIEKGHRVAVLAIDPSSSVSKGSILGDKTRMEKLAANADAFIRPSPAAGELGGVAKATKESIILCEAAGYDRILVETVGVGQSEITVHSLTDFFLLLLISGAGDELQGIKRGIMEMADMVLVNKADGDNIEKAKQAKQQLINAIHLFPLPESGFSVKTEICSSVKNTGLEKVYENIERYFAHTMANGYFDKKRQEQEVNWFRNQLHHIIINKYLSDNTFSKSIEEAENRIRSGQSDTVKELNNLLSTLFAD